MHVFPVPHTKRHVTVDLMQFYIYAQFLGTYMYVHMSVYMYRYAYVCMHLHMYLCVCVCVCVCMVSQVVLMVKKLPANAADVRDVGSIPGSGRSPGGGHGNPLQYSCLENPMDRGAWWATVHGVA